MIRKIVKLGKMVMLLLNTLKYYWNSHPQNSINETNPKIIISYDDGKATDYSIAYPIHKEAGVVAEICAITGKVDCDGYLTERQLREFQEEGWEIISHSRNHNMLCDSFLIESAFIGDKIIYVDHAYRFQEKADCILGNGDKIERVKVVYGSGDCLHIETELSIKHRKYESFRISETQLLDEVLGSRNDLVGMGIKVRNFTYPYNAFSEWSVKVIQKYYESARAERLMPISRGRINKNIRSGFNKYFLYSLSLEDNKITERDIIFIFDKIRKKGAVCIFYAHSSSTAFNTDLLKFVFEEAKKRNIPFVTRSMLL